MLADTKFATLLKNFFDVMLGLNRERAILFIKLFDYKFLISFGLFTNGLPTIFNAYTSKDNDLFLFQAG